MTPQESLAAVREALRRHGRMLDVEECDCTMDGGIHTCGGPLAKREFEAALAALPDLERALDDLETIEDEWGHAALKSQLAAAQEERDRHYAESCDQAVRYRERTDKLEAALAAAKADRDAFEVSWANAEGKLAAAEAGRDEERAMRQFAEKARRAAQEGKEAAHEACDEARRRAYDAEERERKLREALTDELNEALGGLADNGDPERGAQVEMECPHDDPRSCPWSDVHLRIARMRAALTEGEAADAR